MKKSQLRKIIRESIKQLMNEQSIKGLMNEQSTSWWNLFFTANPQITVNDLVGYCADSAGPSWLYNPAIQDPAYLSIINNFNPPYDSYPLSIWRSRTGCGLGTDGYPDSSDESCCYWYVNSPSSTVSSECSRCNSTVLETEHFENGVVAPAGAPSHCPPGWQLTSLGTLSCQTTISGCMDSNASNYNPAATIDDGSCINNPQPINGCTDSTANNFDSGANYDDGSCEYGWKCGQLSSGGAVAEQASMPTGCMPGTSTDPGVFATEAFCLSQNTSIPNGCGGTNMGAKVKPIKNKDKKDLDKSDASIAKPTKPGEKKDDLKERFQKLANIIKK